MLSMKSRREVTKIYAKRYARAKAKKEKSAILNEVVALTGWHRKHAIRILSASSGGQKSRPPARRGPKPRYGAEHKRVLKLVWAILDFPCSKRTKAGMRDVLEALERSGHAKLAPKLKREVLAMSASTIDRLLASDRRAMAPGGKTSTKPGSLLKSQIPVRRGCDWDDAALGFMEIDTVAHCGTSTRGEYCLTLDATDVSSGWTELRAVRNKAQSHVFEAMKAIRARMPFTLLGIDSDNGSEFINDQFLRYCIEEDLVFTRGRPYTKNDGCFVEEKNWSVVRRTVGYCRFEGQAACDVLNGIYKRQRILTNYFTPSAKLVGKIRDGSKVVRFHDEPQTPYRRIMAMKGVGKAARDRMRAEFKAADPLKLRREIHELVQQLVKMAIPQ